MSDEESRPQALDAIARVILEEGRYAEAAAAYHDLYRLVERVWPPAQLVSLLDKIQAIVPDDLWCAITRANVLARAGELQPCRDLAESLLTGSQTGEAWTTANLTLLFQAIQRSCGEHRRIVLLERLSDRVRGYAQQEPAGAAEILHARIRMALEDYDDTTRILANLRARGVQHPMLDGMWDVCERRAGATFPAYDAPKVFCIGLSKTATTSLNAALGMLGLRSIHWQNPYTETLISDSDLLLFDAFSDTTIAWRFEQLYTTFANARFIYTSRARQEWVHSVAAHYWRGYGVTSPQELQRPGLLQRFAGASGRAEMNLYARHLTWENAYAEFDRRVRHFFSDKPAGKLLELDICSGDGWDKLCGFLGTETPATPFPCRNAGPRQSQISR